MEDNPPTPRPPRPPRPSFSTPEQAEPSGSPGRRAAPSVTFQPPAGDAAGASAGTGEPVAPQSPPRKRAPAKKAAPRVERPAEKAAPATGEAPAKATPAKKAVTKATKPVKKSSPAATKTTPGPTPEAATAGSGVTKATPKRAVKRAVAEVAPAVVAPTMETVPDEPAPILPAQRTPAPEPAERTEAWARLLADPGHSPELLALAAVQSLGPAAAEWAKGVREAYPTATPDGIARLAVERFTRFGTASSVFAAVAGSYAPPALLGAAAYTQAELCLHVAAAYGLDPADEARAVDLLVLSRVHPSAEDAVAALASAREYTYENTGLTDAAWRLGRMVVAQAGGWAALRLVNRVFPGTSLLAACLTSRAAVRTSAARATLYFRSQSSQSDGTSV
ncbi:hypothetical protein [Actinoplanes sp. RD1]|uniref:hypothetical protein n=1 Tax=Actinoplanes sp. RD1 TaxID=3064538 RepID=UPI0027416892|nr:hypothetical protein [Actinoplanes sp. RD1]